MSRDYDRYCEDCERYSARSNQVNDDIELYQCLEKDCGAMYMSKTIFTRLKSKGTSETAWKKGVKEINKLIEK